MKSTKKLITYLAAGLLVGAIASPVTVNAYQLQNALSQNALSKGHSYTVERSTAKTHPQHLCRVEGKTPYSCPRGE